VTATIILYAPMTGRPVPKSVPVPAGDYRTHADRHGLGARPGRPTVRVPAQIGRVAGWHFDHPNHLIALNVEVECEPIHAA
jgi:hypothetical protein